MKKNVLRNWDAALIKKLISFVVFLSRKYCFSQIWKISWTSLVNQMLFTSFMFWLWIFLYWKNWAKTPRKNKRTCNSCRLKEHLDKCLKVEHLFSINNLILNDVNKLEFRLSFVRQNTRIIDQSNKWKVLLFKEAYIIQKWTILNNGVKAFREMQLLRMSFNYDVYTSHVLSISFYSNMFLDYILLLIKLV